MAKIEVRLNPDVSPTGSDLAVVNAARRSFNKRSDWAYEHPYYQQECILEDKDKRLIQFLARGMTADDFEKFVHNVPAPDTEEHSKELKEMLWQWRNTPTHDTPFNHCFISFEVKAPIFVARQLVKHEYLIMSEFSRRYITDGIEFYEPDYWRKAAPNKKQGSLEEPMDPRWPGSNQPWLFYNGKSYEKIAEQIFHNLLTNGASPEQARMVLPQSTMTEWTHSGTLGAFAKLCRLRLHKDAQYECRLVAEQIYKHLLEHYPVSAKALVEGPDL